MFFDLDADKSSHAELARLGYSKFLQSFPVLSTTDKIKAADLEAIDRVTIQTTNDKPFSRHSHIMNATGEPRPVLLAVRPHNEKTFLSACKDCDIDIIQLDVGCRYSSHPLIL